MARDFSAELTRQREAAAAGDARAQHRVGLMYALGLGLGQDYEQAVRWYRAAAEQGLAEAQNNLGYMYGTGRGVPQDFVQAYAWYNVAAASGHALARRNRDLLAAQMGGGQLERAQDLSGKLFEALRKPD